SFSIAADREAAGECLAGLRRKRERTRARQVAIGEAELLDDVLSGAGRIQFRAVGAPCQAEPRIVERCGALDGPAADVDHAKRRLRHAVVRDNQIAAVQRLNHVGRKGANPDVTAYWSESPPVWQEG